MTLVTEQSESEEKKTTAHPLSRSSTTIAVMAGPNKGQYFEMPTTGVVTLGRAANSSVQILDKGMSRSHASLFYKNGKVHVEDGYVLTCQSHPRTESILLDYDV